MNLDAWSPSSSTYADLLSVPEGHTKLECLDCNKIESVRCGVSTVFFLLFRSSGMLHCVARLVFPNVLKECKV
jgi:hypothetical protein